MQAPREIRQAYRPVVVEHAQGPELGRVDVPGGQGFLGGLAELARHGPESVGQRLVGAGLISVHLARSGLTRAGLLRAGLVTAGLAAAGAGLAPDITALDHGNSLPATTVVPSY